jgi:BCD family chlorophyll transporter-like MFS transporter
LAPKHQVGIAMGAWGAVQATSQGIGATIGGVVRDLTRGVDLGFNLAAKADGYVLIFGLELLLMLATLIAMRPLLHRENEN